MPLHAAAAVAALWLGVLVAAPWLPTFLAALVYAAGSVICHQIPERSVYLGGAQLPVCARCLGIYAGLAIGAVACLATGGDSGRSAAWPVARWFAIAAVPTLVMVALETAGLVHTTNLVRLLAGTVLGGGVSAVVVWAGATLHYD
jgi:uncharacterized membrane protein